MTKDSSSPWTVLRLINWTREYFEKAQLEQPRLSAEILLAHCLQCSRIELYTRFEYLPSQDQLSTFRSMVKRAAEKEPIAYVVGEKEFYSLRFKVTPDVLIPRPETEILVSEAVAHLQSLSQPGRLWDICTGSGCVAIAVAKNLEDVEVLATDISPKAVEVAAGNVSLHELTCKVRCREADILTMPEDIPDEGKFDVITANPPYVAESDFVEDTVKYEPSLALDGGVDGLDAIRRVAADSPKFLTSGGVLIMEFGYGQTDDVRDLILSTSQFDQPRILKDHQQIERVIVARRK